jgi:carbamoyl-phosphate synthase large subunit
MSLAKEIYSITAHMPKNERFGLADQMQRADVSVPSNIAEGSKRGSRKDFANFLRIAYGSLAELETQLILTKGIYRQIHTQKALDFALEVGKMLHAFTKAQES